jgi:regulator of RNase E activity RraA
MLWNNDKELFELMHKYLYSAVIGDILDQMGRQHQFLPAAIKPIRDDMVIAGRAMTVLEKDLTEEEKTNGAFGCMLEALDDLKENEVYIVSGSQQDYALVGELMGTRAEYLKAAGFVLNGYSRDTQGLLNLSIPTFSFGNYAQDQAPRGMVVAYRVPIQIGDVEIQPGDIVFGDLDGVVIVPRECEVEVITKAYEKATDEKTVGQELRAGKSAAEVFRSYGIL